MTLHRPSLSGLFWAGVAIFAAACGAPKTSSGSLPPTGSGQFAVKLVDAPPDKSPSNPDQILVTIDEVTAHSDSGGWFTIFAADATHEAKRVDLLKLADTPLDLGSVDLTQGTTITQIRLHVDPNPTEPNVVMFGDAATPLKVPSGSQSGIKVHGPWTIVGCKVTAVTLDLDGKKSLFTHPAQQGTEWILRPVIRVKLAETLDVGCKAAVTPPEPKECNTASVVTDCTDPSYPVCQPATDGKSYCAGHPGDDTLCKSDVQCISGSCDLALSERCMPGGALAPCYEDADCVNTHCDTTTSPNRCAVGGPGDKCLKDADCSTTCGADGVCTPGENAGGSGSGCPDTVLQCLSNSCTNLLCDPSMQGQPCKTTDDCFAGQGLTCTPIDPERLNLGSTCQ